MGSFCINCLYDLSATAESRCPECGRAFDPMARSATTLPSNGIARRATHHSRRVVGDWIRGMVSARQSRAYCRGCSSDLSAVRLAHQCPTCGQFFEISDASTYRTSNHAFARVLDRFRHICIWRGVLLALLLFVYGTSCIATQHAILPGAGSRTYMGPLLRLEGTPAVLMGIAWLGLALALHSRYFWGRVEPVWRVADLGVVLGVLMIIAGWGYALYTACAAMN